MSHRGLAEDRDVKVMQEQIGGLKKFLAFHPPDIDLPDPRLILGNTRLLSHARNEERRQEIAKALSDNAVEHIFAPGEDLYSLGDASNEIFIVGRGFTLPLFPKRSHHSHSFLVDEVVGEFECMMDRPRLSSMRALTLVTAFSINRQTVEKLVRDFPELGVSLWQACGVFSALTFQLPYFVRLAMAEKMRVLFSHAVVEYLSVGSDFVIEPGSSAFLFCGGLEVCHINESPGPLDQKKSVSGKIRWKGVASIMHDADVRHSLLRSAGPINFFGREVPWIDSHPVHEVGQVLDRVSLCLPGAYRAVSSGATPSGSVIGMHHRGEGALVLVIPPWSNEIKSEYAHELFTSVIPLLKMKPGMRSAQRWKRKLSSKKDFRQQILPEGEHVGEELVAEEVRDAHASDPEKASDLQE